MEDHNTHAHRHTDSTYHRRWSGSDIDASYSLCPWHNALGPILNRRQSVGTTPQRRTHTIHHTTGTQSSCTWYAQLSALRADMTDVLYQRFATRIAARKCVYRVPIGSYSVSSISTKPRTRLPNGLNILTDLNDLNCGPNHNYKQYAETRTSVNRHRTRYTGFWRTVTLWACPTRRSPMLRCYGTRTYAYQQNRTHSRCQTQIRLRVNGCKRVFVPACV